MSTTPELDAAIARTDCTGSWGHERLLGESEPYIRVISCTGCPDPMVIVGSTFALDATVGRNPSRSSSTSATSE